MNHRDRLTLARRYLRSATRHLEAGNLEAFRRGIAGAREMLREVPEDDYEAGRRDGRVVSVYPAAHRERAELLERLVSDGEPKLSPERDLRAEINR